MIKRYPTALLAIGIVVVENIDRNLERGLTLKQAARVTMAANQTAGLERLFSGILGITLLGLFSHVFSMSLSGALWYVKKNTRALHRRSNG